MTNPTAEQPDPELHVVVGPEPGYTFETPLTLGPDADHADDPIRDEDNAVAPTQPSAFAGSVDPPAAGA